MITPRGCVARCSSVIYTSRYVLLRFRFAMRTFMVGTSSPFSLRSARSSARIAAANVRSIFFNGRRSLGTTSSARSRVTPFLPYPLKMFSAFIITFL